MTLFKKKWRIAPAPVGDLFDIAFIIQYRYYWWPWWKYYKAYNGGYNAHRRIPLFRDKEKAAEMLEFIKNQTISNKNESIENNNKLDLTLKGEVDKVDAEDQAILIYADTYILGGKQRAGTWFYPTTNKDFLMLFKEGDKVRITITKVEN